MTETAPAHSPRRDELLEAAYRHALAHGIADLSLRPLAAAIGTSPRVLMFLFGNKDGLVRALLARARADELAAIDLPAAGSGLATTAERVWSWLAAPEHRPLLRLWAEAYARSLVEPDGPWTGFAEATVTDWLAILAAAQPHRERRTRAGLAWRTLTLGVLRGCLLDLLATGEEARTSAAVRMHLAALAQR